ncbi:hypothetical protein D5018_00265 [Parashewanella curva]|uniref:GH18 domain-containing protein n=1 Tax=Parashewanella curva TaxID=2338552 RepID=A0A3L8Q370_9GAMM|nr:hypothetical protein [Parashewanella curva]RLV61588.1 hypothetical protein D5018_00265 [Parashewanella curva]
MKRLSLAICFIALFNLCNSCFATSAVFAGGPIYKERDTSLNELKKSGFDTLIVWTIHVHEDGSLNFNEEFPLVENGKYIGDNDYPHFRKDVASLKHDHSHINRIEFGLSAAGSPSYTNIKALLTCPKKQRCDIKNNILYRNFMALKKAFPDVDAINNDDETEFDLDSSVKFHNMLADIGFKSTIVPYSDQSFWQQLVKKVNAHHPNALDRVYLQGYAGGTGNSPCDWDFGLPVSPGLSSNTSSVRGVYSAISRWKLTCPKITSGGFMWLYDNFENSSLPKSYADSITQALDVITENK